MQEEINIDELPAGVVILEPQSTYSRAILRFDEEEGVLVYCLDAMIDALMEIDGMDYNEARDYIGFNIDNVFIDGWPIIQ
jgi:hypothetical protein